MTKIYTKTGDNGSTALFTGERVAKSDCNIEALGDIDECNSALGAAIAMLPSEEKYQELHTQLNVVQHALFDVGAAVATPQTRATERKLAMTRFDSAASETLEKWIDEHTASLEPLHCFILPTGHPAAAMLHMARTICRRAERHCYSLYKNGDISQDVMVYLNRLSDYLFVAARKANHLAGWQDSPWKPHA